MEKSSSILIVGGGGTFGLSAAWHLSKSGYTNVTCMDRWMVPSPSSAGYDRNKIVRTEYSNPVYTKLAQEAIELWKDDRWKGIFHHSGWIFGSDGSERLGRETNFHRCVANTKTHGNASELEMLPDWNTTIAKFPFLASDTRHWENKKGFKAIYNGNAGWVKPIETMYSIKRECEHLGVKFVAGPSGTVTDLLYSAAGDHVAGVKTEDGTERHADKIVLAMGSYSDTLIDFEGQLEATAYVVTHLRMTEEQYQRYKGMPVLNISRRGYCFPPNEDRIFKICNTDISYINIIPDFNQGQATNGTTIGVSNASKIPTMLPKFMGGGATDTADGNDLHQRVTTKPAPTRTISIPRDPAYHPTDTQPIEAETVTRAFTRYILPEFTEAPIVASRLCWDMETHDYNWLIDYHPAYSDTLLIATGGSGHSFKNIVTVGKYITQALEKRLEPEYRELWRWRPDRIGKDLDAEERARRPKLHLCEAERWNFDQVNGMGTNGTGVTLAM